MSMLFLQGCAKELLTTRIDTAEERLSRGRVSEENLREMKPVLPPALVARHKIAIVMESIIKGDFSYSMVKADLAEVRDGSLTPDYLSVEAGYILTLVEKMETLNKTSSRAKECAKEGDELKRELEQVRKESEDLRKEIETLTYKLKKLEEIHIESVKRRGKQ